MEARGVEQAQTREVARHAELLGSGREEKQARGTATQGLNRFILRAHRLRGPAEVMGLIHDENVPSRGDGLLGPPVVAGEEAQTGEDELVLGEGIRLGPRLFDRGAPAFIVDMKPDVEPPQQFEQPLMNQ